MTALAFAAGLAPTIGLSLGTEGTAFADHCDSSDSGSTGGDVLESGAKTDCSHGGGSGGGGGAPERSTYCDELNTVTSEPETTQPKPTYTPEGKPLDLFRYTDGREDKRTAVPGYELKSQVDVQGKRNVSPWRTALVKNGGTPTYVKYEVWCKPNLGGHPTRKRAEVWVPLMTPDALAERVDLFARVKARLKKPQVKFADADADLDWLWVQVQHHVEVPRPAEAYESETDTDTSGWAHPTSVTAWLRATPVALTIRVEGDSGEKYLGSCNLGDASRNGCEVLFTHASSITDDGRFYGVATIEWRLSSNAGLLDGLGPLYTNGEFDFQVAEAMAVSGS